MSGFEGSYMGDGARISERAVMECKICWYVYDPDIGDSTRQIDAGTPFFALPEDWSCPECDADAAMFLVKDDPGSDGYRQKILLEALQKNLVADFQEIYNGKMKDVPIINHALQIEAVGFQAYKGQFLGVLISPWFMNLVLLPDTHEDWSELIPGTKELIAFPSGEYEFLHNYRELVGGYKSCSLFSPMGDFSSQLQAKDVAEAVMKEIFNADNIEETDRRADIREQEEARLLAQKEAEAAQLEAHSNAEIDPIASRRAVLRGEFATKPVIEND